MRLLVVARRLDPIDCFLRRIRAAACQFDECKNSPRPVAMTELLEQFDIRCGQHIKPLERMRQRVVFFGEHGEFAAVDRRAFVVGHERDGDEDAAAATDRHADRASEVLADDQWFLFAMERRSGGGERIPRDGSGTPAGNQEVVAILLAEECVVVVRLADRNRSAETGRHRVEQVGAFGSDVRHPTARPREVRVRHDVIQSARHIGVRQAFVIVVVCEEIEVAVEDEPATIPQPGRDRLKSGAVGPNAKHRSDAVVGMPLPAVGLLRIESEERPMSPVIRSIEVAVVPQWVAHRDI